MGSVRPNAPSHSPDANLGRYLRFCSSVPFSKIGARQRDVWAESTTPVVAHTLESSSTAMVYIILSPPAPPYSTGRGIPKSPRGAIFWTVSMGNLSCSSISAARGFTSFSANSLIICLKSDCVGVSLKSIFLNFSICKILLLFYVRAVLHEPFSSAADGDGTCRHRTRCAVPP